jgi:hypothetical protein
VEIAALAARIPSPLVGLPDAERSIEMLTGQRTVTLNVAFLQEIKEENRELRQLLAECANLVRQPIAGRVESKRVVDRLAQLRDQLAMHFALEEAYGYFEDAIEVAPQHSVRAIQLRDEHRQLFLQLCGVVDEAEQLLYHEHPGGRRYDIATGFVQFHMQFRDHEARENALIQRMLNEELGCGD